MIEKEELYKKSPYAELKANKGSGRIRIYTYAYEYPTASNRYDADWYMNYISLSINGVNAEIDDPLIEGSAFERLLKEVEKFRDAEIHEVDFSFLEPGFGFTLSRLASGNGFLVAGQLLNTVSENSEADVHFKFETDRDMLDIFISGMKRILHEYPSRL